MMNKVVITVIGPDKPGVIASISETLFRMGCNIENISQTILQAAFACICVVGMPENIDGEALSAAIGHDLVDPDFHVRITPHAAERSTPEKSGSEPFVVTTSGPDKKGLVAFISKIIAGHHANITNLKAVFQGGSDPGRNIMFYEIDVPAETDFNRLADDLRKKASENHLDLTIQHKNIFDAVTRI